MDPLASEAGARALAIRLDRSELVEYDEDAELVFAWNGSATINVIALAGEDVDVVTTMEPMTLAQARQAIADRRALYR